MSQDIYHLQAFDSEGNECGLYMVELPDSDDVTSIVDRMEEISNKIQEGVIEGEFDDIIEEELDVYRYWATEVKLKHI